MTLPQFESPPEFERSALARRLRELARENIWIGASSWKYEGWLDEPLDYRDRIGALIFEFGARATPAREFVRQLAPFLDALPASFRYAVEVRNRTYLETAYFDCLRERNVAHVFNAWSRMPSLGEQIGLPGAFTADFTVVRALIRRMREERRAAMIFVNNRFEGNAPTTIQAIAE